MKLSIEVRTVKTRTKGSAWLMKGKKDETKKQSNNSLAREHNEQRNAWVPPQGDEE